MARYRFGMIVVAGWAMVAAAPARAYVDLAPTLGRIIRESEAVAIAEVERFNGDKGAVILKKVRDLKGKTGTDPLKHVVIRANESGVDRAILEWAEPGR